MALPILQPPAGADQLTLTVGGKQLSGWEEIDVSLGCEQLPNSFRIRASQKPSADVNPLLPAAVLVNDGDPCTVALGPDTVLSGYVDAVVASYDAGAHTVEIQGRGKTQDLVDCSAEWKGFQISGASAVEIATKLATPYGIQVVFSGDPGPVILQFNFALGETPQEVLELVCRYAGLLYYEDANGQLKLSPAGTTAAASGFSEGQNVQAASYVRSASARYATYRVTTQSVYAQEVFQDEPGLFQGQSLDGNVQRNRKLYIVDGGIDGRIRSFSQRRADWECARRFGRSRQVSLVADSWRDAGGKLWAPNTLAPVSLPRLGLAATQLVISEVRFSAREGQGKTAELLLMPPAAFRPEPVILQPALRELAVDQNGQPGGLDRTLPTPPTWQPL